MDAHITLKASLPVAGPFAVHSPIHQQQHAISAPFMPSYADYAREVSELELISGSRDACATDMGGDSLLNEVPS